MGYCDHLQEGYSGYLDDLGYMDLEQTFIWLKKDVVVDFLQSLFKNQKQYSLACKIYTGEVLNISHS